MAVCLKKPKSFKDFFLNKIVQIKIQYKISINMASDHILPIALADN